MASLLVRPFQNPAQQRQILYELKDCQTLLTVVEMERVCYLSKQRNENSCAEKGY